MAVVGALGGCPDAATMVKGPAQCRSAHIDESVTSSGDRVCGFVAETCSGAQASLGIQCREATPGHVSCACVRGGKVDAAVLPDATTLAAGALCPYGTNDAWLALVNGACGVEVTVATCALGTPCTAPGETVCEEGVLETCVTGPDGCLGTDRGVACPNEECSAGKCGCVGDACAACTDDCQLGDRQISGDDVRVCANLDGDACADWSMFGSFLRPTFVGAEVADAFPARESVGGGWERICDGGAPAGVLLDVLLRASPEEGADNSLRPGDVVFGASDANSLTLVSRVIAGPAADDVHLDASDGVGVAYGCLGKVPSADAGAPGCDGAAVGSPPVAAVRYAAHNASRQAGNNVIMLIDQSGSMVGLVNDGTFDEAAVGLVHLAQNFSEAASDRSGERLSAARRFAMLLEPRDRFGVLAFGEGDGQAPHVYAPCTDGTLAKCFGRDRATWTGPTGIMQLASAAGGRANLWEAVTTAYRFLRDEVADTRGSNHIVVVTDGPDTCAAGENLGSCQRACSANNYDTFRAELAQDAGKAGLPQIRVDVVQFEARGYRGPDPRQMDVACRTGGSYQFIDSARFARPEVSLGAALGAALDNVRLGLMGHWEVATPLTALASDAVAPGSLHRLGGDLTLHASTHLGVSDRAFHFGAAGEPDRSGFAYDWDRRALLPKACNTATDCGGFDAVCRVVCSKETHLCASGASGVTAHDGFACTTDTGGAGACCAGACGEGASCDACAN